MASSIPSSIPSFLLPSSSSQLLFLPSQFTQPSQEETSSPQKKIIQCLSCKGEEFEEVDGLLICNYCGAVSHETRQTQEENEEAFATGFSLTQRIRKKKVRKVLEEPKPISLLDCMEGTQIILQCMLEALIETCHFPTEIKNVASDVWIKYLKNTRPTINCFTKNVQSTIRKKKSKGKKKLAITLFNQDNEILCEDSNKYKSIGDGDAEEKQDDELEEEEEETRVENGRSKGEEDEIISEKNSEEESSSNEESSTCKKSKKGAEAVFEKDNQYSEILLFSSPAKNAFEAQRRREIYLSMSTLVSICYLSSRILQLPYTAVDFTTWIKNNYLPYFNTLTLLPEDFEVRLHWCSRFFRPFTPPKPRALERICIKICQVVHLPVPVFNLFSVSERWIYILGLPAEVMEKIILLINLRHLEDGRKIVVKKDYEYDADEYESEEKEISSKNNNKRKRSNENIFQDKKKKTSDDEKKGRSGAETDLREEEDVNRRERKKKKVYGVGSFNMIYRMCKYRPEMLISLLVVSVKMCKGWKTWIGERDFGLHKWCHIDELEKSDHNLALKLPYIPWTEEECEKLPVSYVPHYLSFVKEKLVYGDGIFKASRLEKGSLISNQIQLLEEEGKQEEWIRELERTNEKEAKSVKEELVQISKFQTFGEGGNDVKDFNQAFNNCGHSYVKYNSRDFSGTMDENYSTLLRTCMQLVEVPLHHLIQYIKLIEEEAIQKLINIKKQDY